MRGFSQKSHPGSPARHAERLVSGTCAFGEKLANSLNDLFNYGEEIATACLPALYDFEHVHPTVTMQASLFSIEFDRDFANFSQRLLSSSTWALDGHRTSCRAYM